MTDIAAEPPRIKRRHVTAAVIGNALEFYDFTTFSAFSVSIGQAFFPATHGGLMSTEYGSFMASLGTFGAGFVLRPIGGLIIGRYADRVGRRPAMLATFLIMGLAILALALIPSYSVIGLAAPILAILARLTQGFALGGEVGPSTAYLVESAPRNLRGLYASWQSASQSMASMVGGLVGFGLTYVLTQHMHDVYAWRIAFLLGTLTLPFGLYIRRTLPESLHAEDHLPDYRPQSYSFWGILRDHRRAVVLGLLILIGGTVATYVLQFMTPFAIKYLGTPAAPAFAVTMVNGVVGLGASLAGGYLSDRFGRRWMMLIPRGLFLLAAYPILLLIVHQRTTLSLLVGVGVLSTLLNISSGAFYVAFTEMLPKRVRSVIFASVYATAIAVFGGTTQLFVNWLINVTGNNMAMAWYLLLATFASVVAMYLMEETAPSRLARQDDDVPDPGLAPTA